MEKFSGVGQVKFIPKLSFKQKIMLLFGCQLFIRVQLLLKEKECLVKAESFFEVRRTKKMLAVNPTGKLRQFDSPKMILVFLLVMLGLSATCQIKSYSEDCFPDKHFYAGFGAGGSNKNALLNVMVGYNTNLIGIEGSIISPTDNRNPALFNGQLIKSFYADNQRFSMLAGGSYLVTTFDKVGGTKVLPVVGMEFGFLLKSRRSYDYSNGFLYFRGQVTGEHFCFMVGLQLIGKKKE